MKGRHILRTSLVKIVRKAHETLQRLGAGDFCYPVIAHIVVCFSKKYKYNNNQANFQWGPKRSNAALSSISLSSGCAIEIMSLARSWRDFP